jgi:hypothetical protein
MHAYLVPPLAHQLTALEAVLGKAEAHCAEKAIEPAALLAFRLYPDMLNFTRQVQLACDFGARSVARLAGDEVPSFPDTETDFAGLKARTGKARGYIEGFGPERFEGAAGRTITLKLRSGEISMNGHDYLTRFALPNVYFHAATAYDILRHNGVVLGKADFLGG